MKITISVKNQKGMEVLYNENEISIKGELFATYTSGAVTYSRLKSNIGYLYRESGETVGISTVCKYKFTTDVYNHKIICYETKQVVACYDGKPTGAIASFIAYLYYLSKQKKEANSTPLVKQQTIIPKHVVTQNNQTQKEVLKTEQPVKEVIIPKEPVKEVQIKQEEYIEPPKYEPPKYEPPAPKVPMPSGGSSNSGSSSAGCLWVILGALAIYSAIKIIPQSWQDMPEYVAAGDTGMTICFFSSVIAAILAVLVAIFKKEEVFSSSMSTFLGVCGVAIVINSIIQIGDVVEGSYEFLGSTIIDIPLSIFASVLGQFQFALPIGIGVIIVCGIIHFAKKK